MKIYITNMVCSRCQMVVKNELEKLGIKPLKVDLGEVELAENLTDEQKVALTESLHSHNFGLIEDKKSRITEKIKNVIVDLVHYHNNDSKINLSLFLSEQLSHDYNYLSTLFSETNGITIEQYFISQKIEKVKELLMYDELTLSEIAFKLNYSSVGYLSNQFKKVTGLTPSSFKLLKDKNRQSIADL
jgi:AraC-like DNA-binding protein